MIVPGNSSPRTSPVRQPVLLGLFTGTAVGVGYLLAGVPNVELMTLVIALAGAALGFRAGFAAGALAAAIFSLGSPYGLPHPLLLGAQICGLGCAAVIGRWGSQIVLDRMAGHHRKIAAIAAAVTGLAATLVYDMLTNLAIITAFDLAPLVVLAGAVPFFLIHAGVNTALFTVLFPLLLPRLVHLSRSPLAGGTAGPTVLAVFLLMSAASAGQVAAQEAEPPVTVTAAADSAGIGLAKPAAPDSLAVLPAGTVSPADEASQRAAEIMGWKRNLWLPFAPTALNWLNWYSSWVPVTDGGLGASSVVLGEGNTSVAPMFVRDGIPVGTGHVLADDPSLVPTQALILRDRGLGSDGWGGTGGLINLESDDPEPDRAFSAYRGIKGKHETYFRAINILTPQAAWRVGFEFEESLDNEGYNFTDEPDEIFQQTRPDDAFPGHGKVRQTRTRLERRLDENNQLRLEFSNGRKTKDSLPALGAQQQEIWDDGIAATMNARTGGWDWRTSLFWRNRDVEWGDVDTVGVDNERRLLETGREGVSLDLTRVPSEVQDPETPLTGMTLHYTHWRVYDSGTTASWAGPAVGNGDGDGTSALARFRSGVRTGRSRLLLGLGAQWDRQGGWGPELDLAWEEATRLPWWRIDLYYGGRAPRSDELLTPLLHVVDTRGLALLPNPELDREKTLRAALLLRKRLVGFDLAIDGSVRRLADGITWQASPTDSDSGAWTNGLQMDAARVTGSVGLEGRFLGWARLKLEGTWQSFDEREGRASQLPPEKYLRLHVMWENHFFREDGILQLGLFSTRQGEMADPWDVTRTYLLPSRTVHDLLLGFRLVGANLSVAMTNLTGERTPMTAGALSPGQGLDLRLYWAFHY